MALARPFVSTWPRSWRQMSLIWFPSSRLALRNAQPYGLWAMVLEKHFLDLRCHVRSIHNLRRHVGCAFPCRTLCLFRSCYRHGNSAFVAPLLLLLHDLTSILPLRLAFSFNGRRNSPRRRVYLYTFQITLAILFRMHAFCSRYRRGTVRSQLYRMAPLVAFWLMGGKVTLPVDRGPYKGARLHLGLTSRNGV